MFRIGMFRVPGIIDALSKVNSGHTTVVLYFVNN